VLQSFLSGRRTALVLPWEIKGTNGRPQIALKASSGASAETVVQIEAGVIANIMSCDRVWCYVTIENFRGYIEQKKLWGVYENETLR
jgi:SH3-like domain-containing protein